MHPKSDRRPTAWVGRVAIAALVLVTVVGCTRSADRGEVQASGRTPFAPESVEAMQAIASCLRDRGFAAEVATGGGIQPGIDIPVGGQEPQAMEDAFEACQSELTAAGVIEPVSRFSPTRLERLYRDYQDAAACLRDLGYDVPEAPSLEAFIETNAAAWDPFSDVPATRSDQERAYGECWDY
ncbi:hypothetical protein BMS3Abin02_01559 [bacterium BMS3Abin02]|nr:hypothetical protein BMS3Abin02_01559 [bacterium BMS3Abin02]